MIGLYNVVEVFHLTMPRLRRVPTLRLQFGNGNAISLRLAQEAFGRLGVAGV